MIRWSKGWIKSGRLYKVLDVSKGSTSNIVVHIEDRTTHETGWANIDNVEFVIVGKLYKFTVISEEYDKIAHVRWVKYDGKPILISALDLFHIRRNNNG